MTGPFATTIDSLTHFMLYGSVKWRSRQYSSKKYSIDKRCDLNLISQVLYIHQVPLASAFFIAPSIAFSWEVNPLRMSKLYKH